MEVIGVLVIAAAVVAWIRPTVRAIARLRARRLARRGEAAFLDAAEDDASFDPQALRRQIERDAPAELDRRRWESSSRVRVHLVGVANRAGTRADAVVVAVSFWGQRRPARGPEDNAEEMQTWTYRRDRHGAWRLASVAERPPEAGDAPQVSAPDQAIADIRQDVVLDGAPQPTAAETSALARRDRGRDPAEHLADLAAVDGRLTLDVLTTCTEAALDALERATQGDGEELGRWAEARLAAALPHAAGGELVLGGPQIAELTPVWLDTRDVLEVALELRLDARLYVADPISRLAVRGRPTRGRHAITCRLRLRDDPDRPWELVTFDVEVPD